MCWRQSLRKSDHPISQEESCFLRLYLRQNTCRSVWVLFFVFKWWSCHCVYIWIMDCTFFLETLTLKWYCHFIYPFASIWSPAGLYSMCIHVHIVYLLKGVCSRNLAIITMCSKASLAMGWTILDLKTHTAPLRIFSLFWHDKASKEEQRQSQVSNFTSFENKTLTMLEMIE